MLFEYETRRNNPNTDELAKIALEMWDAGAHLVMCYSDPKDSRFKRPMGDGWQQKRHGRNEIEAWVQMGHYAGIMAPSRSLGISCVDIDNGVEYRTKCIESLGHEPLVAHESSRKSIDKCHFWYYTPESVGAIKWAGGDIRSDSNHQVLLYNLYAVKAAWDMARSGKAPAVDLRKLDGLKSPSHSLLDGELSLETDSRGVPLAEDIVRADGTPVETDRHDTMIARIARAVGQCSTRKELNERFKLISGAHKEALRNEDDKERKASIKAEIANAQVFLEGAWAKKVAARPVEDGLYSIAWESPDRETAIASIKPFIDEFEAKCREMGWPTPDRVQDDMTASFERAWAKREAKDASEQAKSDARGEMVDRTNKLASEAMDEGKEEFFFTVDSDWGTKQSFIDAIQILGIKFRYNSFTEKGFVMIPVAILPQKQGGGRWIQLDDNLKAVISVAVEQHANAFTSAKKPMLRPVEVGRNKEILARDYLFATNTWCPMRDYFESLPQWCGEMIIHNSMERGGMKIDAGEFTGAVQAFLWLFVVRNCLYPGSSMREYIVLHGERDCGKSKFVELSLPPHLREYFNGAFSLDGTLKVKLERSIGKAVMECGEMGQGGKKDWDAVKQWLTLSDVNGERMAYKEFAKRHKLTATTIFTTNRPELPPSDDAAISRFVWANVLTPATRSQDEDGNEREIVWEHFDLLYDPDRPELGTWREQYFAQALAIVRGSVKTISYQEEGEHRVHEECNPQWLPAGSKNRLVEWNKQAGATYTTDQSSLIDDICDAVESIDAFYEFTFKDGEEFYPTANIRSAIYHNANGLGYEDWFAFLKRGDHGTAHHDRVCADIKAIASDKAIANAMPEVARRLGMTAISARRRVENGGGNKVRGWVLTTKSG